MKAREIPNNLPAILVCFAVTAWLALLLLLQGCSKMSVNVGPLPPGHPMGRKIPASNLPIMATRNFG